MGAKKIEKQSRQVYNFKRRGKVNKIHSISREEIVLTSKYERVKEIDQLSQGDIYYWKGLNGKLSHSCVFDLNDLNINYVEVVAKQIAKGIIYRQKTVKKKDEKRKEATGNLF